MAPTYKDIQRLTGLSLSTISKYFNEKGVSDQNRVAIKQAVEALDYRVNVFAQSLKSKRSRAVGVMIPALNGLFNAAVISEVGHCLRQQGYGILVSDCHGEDALEEDSLSFLLDRQVDGLIIILSSRKPSYIQELETRGIPAVVIDRVFPSDRIDSVVLDNRKAGSMAAELLVQHGHTCIGFVSGPQWVQSMKERKWGFWRTLQRYGIQPSSELFTSTDFTVEEGRKATLQLLRKKNRPTALFGTNDLLTLGMVIAIQEMGMSVPEDITLIGFDNLLIEHVLGKPLTMIVQPYNELGEQAARLLLEKIEYPNQKRKRCQVLVQPILHVGSSVSTPK